MKNLIGVMVLVFVYAAAQDTATLSEVQSLDAYYTQAQSTLEQMLTVEPNTDQAKNVIIFISDGADPVVHTAARILDGQQKGNTGEENILSFETFPNVALVKTYNVDAQVSDSAGASTAWSTGVKTDIGILGVGPAVEYGICSTQKGNEVTNLFELAEAAGMATGTVSTARITHATPAGNYAHAASRDWESDADLSDEAKQNGCTDIATQLVEFPYGDGIDVALGGGRREFIPETLADPEYADQTGDRTDERDLTETWLEQTNAAYVWNQEQFDTVDAATTDKLLGLFEPSHVQFEADRADDTGGEPSLTEMTTKAIDILSKNENGYVLQVEAGRVDHALHGGNAYRALTDDIEFGNAIAATLEKVNLEDTLIIVTSDHGHVMTFAGYPPRGNDILGLSVDAEEGSETGGQIKLALDGKPYTTLGFANGLGSVFMPEESEEETATTTASTTATTTSDNMAEEMGVVRGDLTNVDTTDKDYLQQALVPLEDETHGGSDVAAYAAGPRSYLMRGVIEQNYIFHVIDYALNLTERAKD
jgi:alkaline phosphatase